MEISNAVHEQLQLDLRSTPSPHAPDSTRAIVVAAVGIVGWYSESAAKGSAFLSVASCCKLCMCCATPLHGYTEFCRVLCASAPKICTRFLSLLNQALFRAADWSSMTTQIHSDVRIVSVRALMRDCTHPWISSESHARALSPNGTGRGKRPIEIKR